MNKGFSQDFIEKLKQNNDIVSTASKYINLTRKGKTWWACCPFHFEKTPSFAINEIEQYYHCFGCGASGDVISFVSKYESLDFYDACKKLAEYANMELPAYQNDENLIKIKKKRDRIFSLLVDAAKFYYNNLKKPEATPALEYLASRKLDMSIIKEYGIGYSTGWNEVVGYLRGLGYTDEELLDSGVCDKHDGKLIDAYAKRIIFPIFNLMGNVVGFSGRVIGKADFAKYKNTAQTLVFDKSSLIYGINQIKKAKKIGNLSEIVIVEGQMDVISLFKSGVSNAVACMGTALTANHAKNLKKFADKVILCFDGDSAGKKATLRSIEILVNAGLQVYVVTIPDGRDPDEFVNAFGKSAWEEMLKSALYWVEFLIKDFASNYDLSKPEQKTKFIGDALNVIRSLDSESEQEIYLKMVQQMTNVTMNVLKSDLGKFVSDTVKQEDIVENVDTKINLKENSYVKAVKFIIASLLYKKDYAKLNDSIKPNLKNPDYVKIYDYIENEYKNGKKPIVSKIFDMFDDIENTADLSDIVNYNFVSGEDNEKYYSDCLQVLINTGSANTMDMLLSRLAKCKDENEKREIMLELSKLSKEKNKRGK
ncbi:MAG: DNA primase [Firmicutes bacterium]|nr:DNA primase [Bacillota bacterium]MDY5676628.1 DNA primase [Eubacteriales bacterium]